MKPYALILAAVCCNQNVQAYSNFISNPDSLYPSGCADNPIPLHIGNRKQFFEGNVALIDAENPTETADVHLVAFRAACADPNRSMVLLQFGMAEGSDRSFFQAPQVRALTDGESDHWMSLAPELSTWQVGIEPWAFPQEFILRECPWGCYDRDITFVLDQGAPGGESPWPSSAMSAADFNGSFNLVLNAGNTPEVVIDVPSTEEMFDFSPAMPLSGRLSGNWVSDGALDQGFLISVSELVGGDVGMPDEHLVVPLLMFLSWYTYDADGNLLWLTGAAPFEQGATQVIVPIELVTNGEFLGTKTADREVVGSVTITGNNCNDLGIEYELNELGLGSGTKRLERPFSLETAGYTCRDLEARTLENSQ